MKVLRRSDTRGMRQLRLVGKGLNEIVPVDEAWRKAEDEGLDLVCVSDTTDPMVVRIEDFKKLEYEKKKEKKAQKAKTKTSELKEVQFKMRIADHDLEVKVGKVKAFLERGDKVKATVRLRGRERAHPEKARELIERVAKMVGVKVAPAGPPNIGILEPSNMITPDKGAS